MYTCKFVSDRGTFWLGYQYGTLFDVDPLSGIDVELSTSQGYFQVGNTVEAETVNGLSREVRGVFLDYTNTTLAQEMIDAFAPGVHGNLYYNDELFSECVIEKAPTITLAGRKRSFSLMLYSAYPYWIKAEENKYQLGGYIGAFEFPVCYDEHVFGVKNSGAYIDCYNSGSIERPINLTISCDAEIVNYGIENIETGEFLEFEDTLNFGETVDVYWDESFLRVEKTVDGVTENAFSILNEDSTLFSLNSGHNYLKEYAESGADNMATYVTCEPAEVGAIAV